MDLSAQAGRSRAALAVFGRRLGGGSLEIVGGICRRQRGNACDGIDIVAPDLREHRLQGLPEGHEIEVLRIVVVADMDIQDTVKRQDHPAAAPNARDDILQRELCVLHLGESRIGGIYIALSGTHPGLHELVVQEQDPVMSVLRLELELRCPPWCRVGVVRDSIPRLSYPPPLLPSERHHHERPIKAADLAEPVRALVDSQGRGRQFVAARLTQIVGTRAGGFGLMREEAVGKWGAASYALRRTGSTLVGTGS